MLVAYFYRGCVSSSEKKGFLLKSRKLTVRSELVRGSRTEENGQRETGSAYEMELEQ